MTKTLSATAEAPRATTGPGDLLRRLADVGASGSFSNRRRGQRFESFSRIVEGLVTEAGGPVRILDIGGTNSFWEQRGWVGRQDVRIVLVNLEAEPPEHENIETHSGDATALRGFEDGAFDIVFSNSVIEHLGTFGRQAAMAAEIRRLAPRYWVQTPNFWFPIEPHFLTPAWHWLPRGLRVELLRRRRWGWRGPCPEPAEAKALIDEIRLMRRGEVASLFPDAAIELERLGPFVKCFMAVRA